LEILKICKNINQELKIDSIDYCIAFAIFLEVKRFKIKHKYSKI
jgi:hypothetical protein